MNVSVYYSAGSHAENIFFATFYVIVFIISVPCNMLALWVFFHNKKSSSSKVFLLNLAIADMCYVLVLPIRVIYHMLNSDWPLGEASCRLVGFLFFINLYCSMYLITCIGLDRLLAVILPMKCQSLRRSKNAKVVCIILWALVTCSMVPVLFTSETVTTKIMSSGRNMTICTELYLEKRSFKALVSTVVAFTVPLVSLTVSYILIFFKLRVMTFQQRTFVQTKAVRMILLTLATFIVAFVPYFVHRLLYIERYRQEKSDFVQRYLAFGNCLTSALTCLSGIMDPVMYFFLAHNYQKSLLQLCGRATNKDRQQSTT
ncbi:uracil nucleotide/cysteinyl leukotriene receptor [Hemibagrus wyckioides]|uniref:uracil nucleotide/cysteinyl leukotriene receptor n=1 Tax=Hemibagrus wyckioides TaxID=337641 RepID=UPI00266D0382|nr:uracil nucleotide/cysteinyl leukotriene receptor [Hemibagrus wyckioides]